LSVQTIVFILFVLLLTIMAVFLVKAAFHFFRSALSGVPLHILLHVFASGSVVRCQRQR